MRRTRPRHARGPALHRRAVAVGSALALTLGAGVAAVAIAAPAQADTTVTGSELHWGFKDSFRNYVGNQTAALPPIGPLPVGERITVAAPATFDPATPAVATSVEEAKRPYVFAGDEGEVASATSVSLPTAGEVTYNFPSHYFVVKIGNPRVVVSGSTATIYADTYLNATESFGEFEAGEMSGTQIPVATTDTVNVSVAADGKSATVTGTNVILTAEGADYVPYNAGDPLDNFTATATLDDPVAPQQPNGSVTLSKNVFDPAGDTVTVTGSGFYPTVLAGSAPLASAGVPGGIYVRFGAVQDVWQPSAGAAGGTRSGPSLASGGQFWVLPDASRAALPGGGAGAGYATLNADGTFQVTLNVSETWTGSPTGDGWNYGVYTYGASGAVSAGYETFTPISFAETPPPPGDDEQTITATVPQATPGGDFTWTIDSANVVDLGEMSNAGAYYQATGEINTVTVTDTRTNQANSWSLSGQLSDFTGGLSGTHLGWTPKVVAAGAGAGAGAAVLGTLDGGPGLASSQTLGSAADGHAAGSGTLGADLDLKVPVTTAAGQITATLTLTALS